MKEKSYKIQKVLSQIGLDSRRHIERLVIEEKIKVNGKIATIGQRISVLDKVEFENKLISLKNFFHTPRIIIYNKPLGELVTRFDPMNRKNVFSNLPKIHESKWISVGRLDINTSGLLIFTNSGDLANRLMHPKYNFEKGIEETIEWYISNLEWCRNLNKKSGYKGIRLGLSK